MKVFAISDLHLALSADVEKPMDKFGSGWENHYEKIAAACKAQVGEEDALLVAGDISWAMRYAEAEADLAALCALPGKKVFIKGNHDFWHESLSKTRSKLTGNTFFLQNDSVRLGEIVFAGSRGWKQQDEDYTPEDEKIYARELERLRLSLEDAKKRGGTIVGMAHYPPFSAARGSTPVTRLFASYGVKRVVFGHIHGDSAASFGDGRVAVDGTEYYLTSCDFLGFKPLRLL